MSWLWAVFTVIASGGQVLRNAQQKELTTQIGTVGATHVRFLFGLPFALLFLAVVLTTTGQALPSISRTVLSWTFTAALAQIGATALLRRNLLVYGAGGLVAPFVGIKLIDLVVHGLLGA